MNNISETKGVRFLPHRNQWQARIKIEGKEVSKCFATFHEALDWRDNKRLGYHQNDDETDVSVHTFVPTCAVLFPQWLDQDRVFESPQTLRLARSTVRAHLLPTFGNLPPCDVTPRMVLTFLMQLCETPKPRVRDSRYQQRSLKTVKNIRGMLATFFDWCVIHQLVDNNPVKDTSESEKFRRYLKSRADKDDSLVRHIQKKALNATQAKVLLEVAYAYNPEDATALEFLLHTAIRLGELAALDWADIQRYDAFERLLPAPVVRITKTRDCHTGVVQHGAKWGSDGDVELNSAAQDLIARWYDTAQKIGYPVGANNAMFPCAARNPKAFSDRVARLAIKAGVVERRAAHSMRHTSLTLQVVGGNSLEAVQKVARHTTAAMTARYFDASQLPTHGVTEAVALALKGSEHKRRWSPRMLGDASSAAEVLGRDELVDGFLPAEDVV